MKNWHKNAKDGIWIVQLVVCNLITLIYVVINLRSMMKFTDLQNQFSCCRLLSFLAQALESSVHTLGPRYIHISIYRNFTNHDANLLNT